MKRTIVPASVLLFLVTSALFVAAIFFREPFEYAYAQLYPTPVPTGGYNCSMNVGCCEGNKTKVAYLSCDGGVACNENDCRPVGQGACVYIAGNNCEVSTCHPTYCYDTGGLGGCPGGIGSIDDCGGVSCNSCDGGGGGGEPTPTGGGRRAAACLLRRRQLRFP
ncbi:MAG: hypothetical protein HND47_22480 [Chloroflexi bacterium]|nr:hypothetical protein [Chloroflexota bacterium]